MGHRSLVLAIAAFASIYVTSANAQPVYVAPGGVYIGGGPVYVTPAPAPYAASSYGYGYGPPPVVAPAPAIVAPTAAYGPGAGYYDVPLSAYAAPPPVVAPAPVIVAPTTAYGPGAGYSAYAAELPPRPPAPVPYYGIGRCAYGSC
jgi:hypothetical protein